jgi:hypothetical protein
MKTKAWSLVAAAAFGIVFWALLAFVLLWVNQKSNRFYERQWQLVRCYQGAREVACGRKHNVCSVLNCT